MVQFLYPPRPRGRIPHSELNRYERSGKWLAQRKYNGTRNLIHITPDRRVVFWNRHGVQHKRYNLTNSVIEEILSLNLKRGEEYWLDSEILNKLSGVDNRIVFYDVLQAGRYLFGRPNQLMRLDMLAKICHNPEKLSSDGIGLYVSPSILLAENFFGDFENRFREAEEIDILEGLVLRKQKSSLDNFGEKEYEVGWQIRCRKPHKNYIF